ncbi:MULTISPECIES: helix-turn-helix domain-containing protein [Clostridium]|jgi:transcriptional regulator with XRE-family HTH domain|uniref:Putative transcriptional regulator n=1 Tax=Clostridium saccharoperbutylacetonicum N1-4(HMT) TaxID=931276 RepID=M1MDQ6_9CLOT|nr:MULTISPECIES: helix-turn-helix transcriptional regulator [Clostridium]AGF54523.1 putative transcriptional regulator [Clostridium saccharoperbutylacetonicum N1-4(HMT)]NRT58957.1 transcriptional regulator with XRE-family HTH domain [Clostridium saccharoperbutylacetonicum]NSB28145.1 transcriptional regulator with XRE-family HTH domain [Clostridium saccharoperbutylacetonicum]NSB41633.1 transcriptional regulator with XRE-family HTH domain [Clostridium saccharoperbutylacetonicum]
MLGDKVKFLRKQMNITQQKLAETIGVSQSTIGMIEGNKQGASNDTLIKLANVLNTTVDYLLGNSVEEITSTTSDDENEMNYDNDIRRIERARKKMDAKNKEKMMQILRTAFDEYFDD